MSPPEKWAFTQEVTAELIHDPAVDLNAVLQQLISSAVAYEAGPTAQIVDGSFTWRDVTDNEAVGVAWRERLLGADRRLIRMTVRVQRA